MAGLQEVPGVEAVGAATYDSIEIDGRPVATVGIDGLRGQVFPTLLEGRAPRRQGRDRARDAHAPAAPTVAVGDTVRATISGRSPDVARRRAGGVPEPRRRQLQPDEPRGGRRDDRRRARRRPERGRRPVHRPADPHAARRRSRGGAAAAEQGPRGRWSSAAATRTACSAPSRPGDVSNYTRVRGTGVVLSAALAVIALGLLVHVLVSSVRRRRGDLAVFKTLGFVRRQVAGDERVAGDDDGAARARHRDPGRPRGERPGVARVRRGAGDRAGRGRSRRPRSSRFPSSSRWPPSSRSSRPCSRREPAPPPSCARSSAQPSSSCRRRMSPGSSAEPS